MSKEICKAIACSANQTCEVKELVKRINPNKGSESRIRELIAFQMMMAADRSCPQAEAVTKETKKIIQEIPQEAFPR